MSFSKWIGTDYMSWNVNLDWINDGSSSSCISWRISKFIIKDILDRKQSLSNVMKCADMLKIILVLTSHWFNRIHLFYRWTITVYVLYCFRWSRKSYPLEYHCYHSQMDLRFPLQWPLSLPMRKRRYMKVQYRANAVVRHNQKVMSWHRRRWIF